MQCIQHRQIAFTRHAKCMGDALGQEAVNEKVASELCCHARIVPPGELPSVLAVCLFRRAVVVIGPTSLQRLALKLFIAQRQGIFKCGNLF